MGKENEKISDKDVEKINKGVQLIAETLEVNKFCFNTGIHTVQEFLCRISVELLSKEDQKKMLKRMTFRIRELNHQHENH